MLKKLDPSMTVVALLLLLWIDLVDSIFFGNSCGCQQPRSICPPTPVCSPATIRVPIVSTPQYQGHCPPCECSGGSTGIINGGSVRTTYIHPGTQIAGASYATNPTFISSPTLITNPPQYIPVVGPQFVPNPAVGAPQLIPGPSAGPQLIPGPGGIYQPNALGIGIPNNYVSDRGGDRLLPNLFTTVRPHDSSRNSIDEDVYDEVIPTSGQQVADVSVDSKKLVPHDVYLKRNRYLRQLRNRALRQFSAKSVTEVIPEPEDKHRDQQNVCNNDKLAKIMQMAMVDDITVSKKLVRKAAELAFDGKRFDVLCAIGDFSYSVYARQYCEATKGNITCFAFV